MSEIAERYRKVAAGFADRVASVPTEGWERPSPCDGWVARDVVRHLIEWVPPFLRVGAGIDLPAGPAVDEDPVAAWAAFSDGLQGVLDDPERSGAEFRHDRAGNHRVDDAIAMFVLGDVLVHTWDLARAVGLDERLDPGEVHHMRIGLEGLGDALARSGHYAAALDVPEDADDQTRLLALTGRRA